MSDIITYTKDRNLSERENIKAFQDHWNPVLDRIYQIIGDDALASGWAIDSFFGGSHARNEEHQYESDVRLKLVFEE